MDLTQQEGTARLQRTYARQGRRQGAWHAWGAAKQAAGRGGRWQAACMAGSGRTGAAQYGACKGLEEQSRGHR